MTQLNSKRKHLGTSGIGVEAASGKCIRRIRVFWGSSWQGRPGSKVRVVERGQHDRWREPGSMAKPTGSLASPQGTQMPTQGDRLEDCFSSSWGMARLGYDRPASVPCASF